jgi:ATP-dependent exoDNAse (exonuclease V) beta subunit
MNIMNDQAALLQEDERSRRRALELASFIVEAPAGGGKSELLTQRLLRLLQTVREPEEIIAITFTNKAAAEMRLRILDSLNMAAAGSPPPQPHKQITYALGQAALARSAELDWHLLQHPSRLRIYTIDSLSSHLARQMPLMSRFGAQPTIGEDANLHYEEAARRTLELIDDADAGVTVRQALRYLDNDALKLGKLLASMLASRDQWLDYTQAHAPQAAEAALARLIEQDIATAAQALDGRVQSALMPIARYAAGNLPCEHCVALLRDWETALGTQVQTLPMWCAICELLLTAKGDFRLRFDKNMGLPALDEAKPYKQALEEVIAVLKATPGAAESLARLRVLPRARHNAESWQIVAALARLLNIAVAQLWLVFQEHGEVDFVEVAQRALLALQDESGDPTELALKLDYRIQHLLVDEFQDTSPVQVRLLRCLTHGWSLDDGRTLFAVGDPMQSIYRFRKAEVGLFLDAARRGIGPVQLERLRLCRNNRSCPPLIDWVNRAFSQVFPRADSAARGAIRYREFVATRADEPGSGVHVHPLLMGEGDDVESMRVREAEQVVAIIRETRAQHPQRKIAVLVRARSHLETLVAEIRRHHGDLHFQAVEIETLAGRQVVQDLLALAHALHHRADRVHWLAILRAPWCGLKLADLHALAADDRYSTVWSLMRDETRLQNLSEDGRRRLLHVRGVLEAAFMQQGRQRTSRWLHGVWLMLGGAQCLWEAGDVRDVQGFFDKVEQLDATGQFSVERLASEVEKLYAAPDVEADGSLQFMTIHKSKGLEFDTVILPGLERTTGHGDQPLLLWEEIAS